MTAPLDYSSYVFPSYSSSEWPEPSLAAAISSASVIARASDGYYYLVSSILGSFISVRLNDSNFNIVRTAIPDSDSYPGSQLGAACRYQYTSLITDVFYIEVTNPGLYVGAYVAAAQILPGGTVRVGQQYDWSGGLGTTPLFQGWKYGRHGAISDYQTLAGSSFQNVFINNDLTITLSDPYPYLNSGYFDPTFITTPDGRTLYSRPYTTPIVMYWWDSDTGVTTDTFTEWDALGYSGGLLAIGEFPQFIGDSSAWVAGCLIDGAVLGHAGQQTAVVFDQDLNLISHLTRPGNARIILDPTDDVFRFYFYDDLDANEGVLFTWTRGYGFDRGSPVETPYTPGDPYAAAVPFSIADRVFMAAFPNSFGATVRLGYAVPGGYEPKLRLSQRNDGLGTVSHPRLLSTRGNAPSSYQRSAAPRVGLKNRYR